MTAPRIAIHGPTVARSKQEKSALSRRGYFSEQTLGVVLLGPLVTVEGYLPQCRNEGGNTEV